MSYDRRWLDDPHIGDHVGRSIWALGEVLSTAWVPGVVGPAGRLLTSLVTSLNSDVSLRTAAYAILGIAQLDPDRLEPNARRLLEQVVVQLEAAYEQASSDTWRWFEGNLRYDNARLPQALIVGGEALGSNHAVAAGLESLNWLGNECGLTDGMLRLTGHRGRHRNEPAPERWPRATPRCVGPR